VSEDSSEHHRSVHRRRFRDLGSWDGLTERERALLARHGAWLQALAARELRPITAQQERFVHVCEGQAEPVSEFELAWVKYEANRRAFLLAERHRLVELALNDRLTVLQLEQILNNAERFNFSAEEVNVFNSQLAKLKSAEPQYAESQYGAWASCRQCGGDGGAGGRCPRCGGNGFEP